MYATYTLDNTNIIYTPNNIPQPVPTGVPMGSLLPVTSPGPYQVRDAGVQSPPASGGGGGGGTGGGGGGGCGGGLGGGGGGGAVLGSGRDWPGAAPEVTHVVGATLLRDTDDFK